MIAVTEFAFLSADESILAARTYELDVVSAAGLVCAAVNPELHGYFGDGFSFAGPEDEINLINNFIEIIENRVIESIVFGYHLDSKQIRSMMLMAFGFAGKDYEVGRELSLKDLVAAIQLFREGVCTFREAVEIAKQ